MKILQVRIRNLNSIKGDWTIDFRSPEFVQSGLFVITGPTGSGKTTILDAICLALYGETPRLGVVGTAGNGNEVMTKGSRECLAEVEFKTSAGKSFRATWSQEMSRVGAKNPYRQYFHKVVDLDTGNTLTTTPAEGATRVEELTGLSFERFRQSVMLAQNGFADFLKANENDRATLLEQITGTGIYTRISKKVHELTSQAASDVKLVRARLEGISILDDLQIEQLKTRLDELNGELRPDHQEKDRLDQAISWLKRIGELQDQANSLLAEQQELESKKTEFEPMRLVLLQALQAREIDADWRLVDERRKALDGARVDLKGLLDALPGLRQAVGQATVARDASDVALKKAKTDQAQAVPRIDRARELDTLISQNQRRLKADSEQLDNKTNAHGSLTNQNTEALRQQMERAGLLKAIHDSISSHAGDQSLESGLALVRDRLERLSKLSETLVGVQSDLRQASTQADQHLVALNKARLRLTQAENAEKLARESLDRIGDELAGALDGHDGGWWTARLASLTKLGSELGAALDTIEAIGQRRDQIQEMDQSDLRMNGAIGELSDAICVQEQTSRALSDKLALLRERQRFSGKVADLERLRAELESGQPCPLCGSLQHPFRLDGLPLADETADQIKSTEAELLQVASRLTSLNQQLGTARGKLQANVTQRDKATMELADLCQRLVASGQKCGFDAADAEVETTVGRLVRENDLALDACRKVTDDAARLQASSTVAQTALDLAVRERSDANMAVEKSVSQHDAAAENVGRLDKRRVEIELQRDQDRTSLLNDVAVWGVTSEMLDDAAAVLKSLEARRVQWRDWTADATRLEKEMSAASAEIGQREKQLVDGKTEIDELSKKLELQRKELAALLEQRRQLLGDHDPDQFRRTLDEAVEKARVDLKQAEDSLQGASANLDSNGRQQNQAQARMDQASGALEAAERAFDTVLTGRGFVNREAFLAARLDEARLTELQRVQESLDNAQGKLTGRIEQNQSMLVEQRAKALTDRPLQELLDQVAVVQKRIADLNQELGAIRAGLDADRRARESRAAEVAQLQKLQQDLEDWALLDRMIGSADGKSYRVYVQIITFRTLVALANQHLGLMTDRYRLVVSKDREGNPCLNLDVYDAWQGGESRTVMNLSGGETFIVSLALALGLAGLASQQIRIDSLFMDEGFGSLDDESLNTAVNTLADIQRHGKLIGVISHVEALKTAIPVRIDVKRVSGGVSVLDGPGVMRQV